MDKLIRCIGSFIITCVLFACPICLTLLFACDKASKYGLFTAILMVGVITEFATVAFTLYYTYE